MLCDTCRWTERPGFVRRIRSDTQAAAAIAQNLSAAAEFIPCPDCGGHAIAHCCEGLCAQPEAEPPKRDE